MEKAFEKTFKIIDKLLPEVNEKNLEILGRAIHKHTDDPFVVLRNAGIDIEPELEEFRQFLAEISGKKIKSEKQIHVARVPGPSEELARAKLEVLSILNGLEFSGFSDEAKQKAIERLSTRIREVSAEKLTPENVQRLGLYAFAVEIIKRSEFGRAKEIEGL